MEPYGEDPHLTGQMAIRFIRALQGNYHGYFKTIDIAKDYAVHGGPESEWHTFYTDVFEYNLHGTYPTTFKMNNEQGGICSRLCA